MASTIFDAYEVIDKHLVDDIKKVNSDFRRDLLIMIIVVSLITIITIPRLDLLN